MFICTNSTYRGGTYCNTTKPRKILAQKSSKKRSTNTSVHKRSQGTRPKGTKLHNNLNLWVP